MAEQKLNRREINVLIAALGVLEDEQERDLKNTWSTKRKIAIENGITEIQLLMRKLSRWLPIEQHRFIKLDKDLQ